MASEQSPYDILQVSPSASPDQIRRAFLDLVRVWHPDRFVSDPRLQKIAEEKLKEITRAYEILGGVQQTPDRITNSPEAQTPTLRPFVPGSSKEFWLKALGFGGCFLALWVLIVSGMNFIVTPLSDRAFMDQEAVRLNRLFGPEPALALDGSGGLGNLHPSAHRSSGGKQPSRERPANGADLIVPRGTGGLGELDVRNASDLDCVVRVVSRDSPGASLRALYVRAGQGAAIENLRPDIYRLRVAFGEGLDTSSLGFVKSNTDDFWVGPFEYFQVETSRSRRGVKYSVVLKPPASAEVY